MILTMMSVMAAVGRTSIYCFETLEKVFHAAKQVYKSILASANILNDLRNRAVTKTRTPREDQSVPEEEHLSQQKWRSTLEISVVS